MDENNQTNENKSDGGCIKGCLISFVLIMIIAAIGGWYAYNYVTSNASDWAAMGVEKLVEVALKEIPLKKSDEAEILKPINNFCDEIRNNKVSMKQGLSVVGEVFKGPVIGAIMMMGFNVHFVEPHKFKEKQNKQIHMTVNRYRQALATEKLDESETKLVFKKLTVKYNDNGQKKTRLKDSLTEAQLKEVLSIMKKQANDLKIPNKVENVNVGSMIEKAIKIGLKKKIE